MLEIVLGAATVIFISILASRVPATAQPRARRTRLLAAGAMRTLLLLDIGWIVTLTPGPFHVDDLLFIGSRLKVGSTPTRIRQDTTRKIS